ncbi:LOW QUALITY PROTEIN: hypothetical protein ACHAXN_008391, partial [Cyclotella atomus]
GNSRASSTFAAHQRNNERLILFLYDGVGESGVSGKYASMLADELCHCLDDIKVKPDYTSVIASHRKYSRAKGKRICSRERMTIWKASCISSFLGPPGLTPPCQTVIFDAFTASADTIAQFLTTVKSNDNGIKKGQIYASYRSSMTFLFRRYRYSPLQACSR